MPQFPYKTPPLEHQRRALQAMARHPEFFALLMEQGTGKTGTALMHLAWRVLRQELEGAVVLAPRGVHTNWVREEVPKHIPDCIVHESFAWQSSRYGQKQYMAALEAFLASEASLAIFALNIDALKLDKARALIKRFIKRRRSLVIVDESADIASPSSQRGRMARLLGQQVPARMILDGTPWAESPFELYGQFKFLKPGCIGVRTYGEMKRTYGEWVNIQLRGQTDAHGNPRTFPKLIGYRNLDRLAKLIAPFSFRITKDEALPFLPERMYLKVYFELTPRMQQLYETLRQQYFLELSEGYELQASHVLTRMLRLQQLSCGYLPVRKVVENDAHEFILFEDPAMPADTINPRMEAFLAHLASHRKPSIVWVRFTQDMQVLRQRLTAEGYRVCVYEGSDQRRQDLVGEFQAGQYDIFLANPAAAGRGLTLTRAWYMYHYSHYFGLRRRLQADDRFHRIGLDHPVYVVDVIGVDTVDEAIVASHRSKREISQLISNDPSPQHWL